MLVNGTGAWRWSLSGTDELSGERGRRLWRGLVHALAEPVQGEPLRVRPEHWLTPAGETVRVRFGVGRPPEQWEGADWVLARFSSAEEKKLKELIPLAADAAVAALLEGPLVAANRYNRRLRKEPED